MTSPLLSIPQYFSQQRKFNYTCYLSGMCTVEEMLKADVKIYNDAVEDLKQEGLTEEQAMTHLVDVFEAERGTEMEAICL